MNGCVWVRLREIFDSNNIKKIQAIQLIQHLWRLIHIYADLQSRSFYRFPTKSSFADWSTFLDLNLHFHIYYITFCVFFLVFLISINGKCWIRYCKLLSPKLWEIFRVYGLLTKTNTVFFLYVESNCTICSCSYLISLD